MKSGPSTQNPSAAADWSPAGCYGRYAKPAIERLLGLLKLDVTYTRAQGEYLYFRDSKGNENQVVDMLGGYGSTILGHNPPQLKKVIRDALDRDVPVHAQASIRGGAALLAEALNQLISPRDDDPKYYVHLLNTGTEAVEAAFKHALLEWQIKRKTLLTHLQKSSVFHEKAILEIRNARPLLIALEGSFHGKAPTEFETFLIHPNADETEIAAALGFHRILLPSGRTFSRVMGVIVEPVQGEGGVRPLSARFLQTLAGATQEEKIPLITDEVQSGMWRTGRFLASQHAGLVPDYILLGKSLGGGMSKIAALLVHEKHYVENSALSHNSTFAEDDVSSLVALRTLELLQSDTEIESRARSFEARVRGRLEQLMLECPSVLREVRGTGFLIGVELNPDLDGRAPNILGALHQSGYLTYLFASYLLHRHSVRVAPTLTHSNTLRLEPMAGISEESVEQTLLGLESLVRLIHEGRFLDLTSHIWTEGAKFQDSRLVSTFKKPLSPREKALPKVAFLSHVIDETHFSKMDPMIAALSPADRSEFLTSFARVSKGFVYHEQPVTGKNGKQILLQCYGIVAGSSFFESCVRHGDPAALDAVTEATSRALSNGASHVGLGQYTSIVSHNGLLLPGNVTTGNSLTVGFAWESLLKLLSARDMKMDELRVGVVGAAGNICNVLAQMVGDEAKSLLLVHREPLEKSAKFQGALNGILNNSAITLDRVETTVDPGRLVDCDVVIMGTNSANQHLLPAHLKRDAVVLDVSVPSNIHPSVFQTRPDVECFLGGYARLPDGQILKDGVFPCPAGETFACMAETLTLALHGWPEGYSRGDLNKAQVFRILEMANSVGITAGTPKKVSTFGGLGLTRMPQPESYI